MPRSSPPSDPAPSNAGNPAVNLAQFTRVELLNECRRRFGTELAFLTFDELILEMQRRALGLYLGAVLVREDNTDAWKAAFKGSPQLLGALSAVTNCKMFGHLEACQLEEF